ncbi:uncharacterized protein LOC129219153 [Uloborus diversus]|uniref:uncharacterized protein LOC129219153 n=1 Tax=Uloborus diversus TaxID=327109 RepID=UPI002409D9BD|nr:uncharacterized protein LOC129219153 [Uloborus diversus]
MNLNKSTVQSKHLNTEFNENSTASVNIPKPDLTVSPTYVKLPRLTIETFDGDICKWPEFWSRFKTAVHENYNLSNVEKFSYLKSYLCKDAELAISGLSITEENYSKSISILESRFGKKELIIDRHMANLLSLESCRNSRNVLALRRLYDKCQVEINALKSLGIEPDSYGTLLFPILIRSTPGDLALDFNKNHEAQENKITDLINFLKREVESRERMILITQPNETKTFPESSRPCGNSFPPRGNEVVNNRRSSESGARNKAQIERIKNPTASELCAYDNNSKSKLCLFCREASHSSINCGFAKSLPLEKRKSMLIKKGSCFRCLGIGHLSASCKAKVKCNICGKRHLDIMCWDENKRSDINEDKPNKRSEINENTTLANNECSREVYLQTLVVYIKENNLKHFLRLIIDLGSQRSYISKFAARKMKLTGLGEEYVSHGLFGGITHAETHQRYFINLSNIEENYNFELEVLDQKKICASLPKMTDPHYLKRLKDMNIQLSDAAINEDSCLHEKNPNEINLLIGADYAGKLLTGNIKHISGSLVAVETRLGWTIMGKSDIETTETNSSMLVLSLHVNNAKITDLWNLDTLGIKDDCTKRTQIETQELALEHFRKTVSRDSTGRYKVNLPWLDQHPPLLDNKELARKRLKHTVRSLKSKNRLTEYQEVFYQWEKEGIIEEVDQKKAGPVGLGTHYLPHRAVFKDNSTTKVRPVFDGSAKTRNSVSINECVEKGPNLIELIPAILNRFRWGKIGVISDIKQAFLQIALNDSDRDVLRFLWWKEGDPQKEVTYRHCRVVFGISSSSFLLLAVLNHVLDQVEEPFKTVAMKLKNSLYVDNCVASVDSVAELEHFRTETQKILKPAKFDLRGWKNTFLPEIEEPVSDSSIADEEKEVPVLGLAWDRENDNLSCQLIQTGNEDEQITKRKILSVAHQIFDPIGFTCPVTLMPKLLLQECWKLGISWDSKLPEEIIQKFEKWKKGLSELKYLKIPRRLSHLDLNESKMTLHTFCDASKLAYAACVFLRVENDCEVTCQLIQARSRVAPLKRISIPRMELLACNIGARLANSVKTDLSLEGIESFF